MYNDILTDLDTAKLKIVEAISGFRDEDFNIVPFEGSWTAGQVAEHISKSVSGVLEVLYGPVIPTARDPYEKLDQMKEVFLDFGIKLKSPEFALPGQAPVEKNMYRAALEDTLTKIAEATTRLDLSQTCTRFEMPVLGLLTRAEWTWFAIFHTQRHTRQLKNILAALTSRTQVLK